CSGRSARRTRIAHRASDYHALDEPILFVIRSSGYAPAEIDRRHGNRSSLNRGPDDQLFTTCVQLGNCGSFGPKIVDAFTTAIGWLRRVGALDMKSKRRQQSDHLARNRANEWVELFTMYERQRNGFIYWQPEAASDDTGFARRGIG